jgi:hypothetical protein
MAALALVSLHCTKGDSADSGGNKDSGLDVTAAGGSATGTGGAGGPSATGGAASDGAGRDAGEVDGRNVDAPTADTATAAFSDAGIDGAGGSADSPAEAGDGSDARDVGGGDTDSGDVGADTGDAGSSDEAGSTSDAGDSDAGPADNYLACYDVADPSDFVEVIKTTPQGMCVRLMLESPYNTGVTLGLTIPRGWNVWDSARWPSSVAPCTTPGTPSVATQASRGTGTVTMNGSFGRPGFSVTVDAVLIYQQGDSGVSESESLRVRSMPGAVTCSSLQSQ